MCPRACPCKSPAAEGLLEASSRWGHRGSRARTGSRRTEKADPQLHGRHGPASFPRLRLAPTNGPGPSSLWQRASWFCGVGACNSCWTAGSPRPRDAAATSWDQAGERAGPQVAYGATPPSPRAPAGAGGEPGAAPPPGRPHHGLSCCPAAPLTLHPVGHRGSPPPPPPDILAPGCLALSPTSLRRNCGPFTSTPTCPPPLAHAQTQCHTGQQHVDSARRPLPSLPRLRFVTHPGHTRQPNHLVPFRMMSRSPLETPRLASRAPGYPTSTPPGQVWRGICGRQTGRASNPGHRLRVGRGPLVSLLHSLLLLLPKRVANKYPGHFSFSQPQRDVV